MLAIGDPLTMIAIATVLIGAGAMLSRKKPKAASPDDYLGSTATMGSYIPLVIGRESVAPVIILTKDMTESLLEDSSLSTGFGKGGGGVPTPPSVLEYGVHALCVGPGKILHKIRQNNKVIWTGPITPATHPSGSTVETIPNEGTFKIWWGFRDDPPIPNMPVASRFSLSMKVVWEPKDLGNSRQWPRLEYEVTCPCYSQIASCASEIPLEGDDDRPSYGEWMQTTGGGYVPFGRSPTDRAVFDVFAYNAGTRELVILDRSNMPVTAGGNVTTQSPQLGDLFPTGGIIRLFTYNGAIIPLSTLTGHPNNLSSLLPNGEWKYFWIVRSYQDMSFSLGWEYSLGAGYHTTINALRVVLGPPALPIQIKNPADPFVGPTDPSGRPVVCGWAMAIDTSYSDGINPVHMVDQILFAKHPYGAGRDRGSFDTRSIDAAADVLSREKIRGGLAVVDGEGAESVLAQLLQDIGLVITWDVEVGKYVFRAIRYEETSVEIPREIVLAQPEMESVQGDMAIDLVAFTYRDRQRNYREVPVRAMDSGQVSEYEVFRSQKTPIDVTKDRDSIGRIVPRRQQEALTNVTSLEWEMNHGAALAMPGSRFRAPTVEDPSLQFLITDVEPSLDSSRVVVTAVIDAYNPPQIEGTDSVPLQERLAGPGLPSAVLPLSAFEAIEIPHGTGTQVLFLGARQDTKTSGFSVWGSRDGLAFSLLGEGVVAVRCTLDGALGADDAEGTYLGGVDEEAIEDLTLDEPAWRAGRQLMLIGGEVIYLRNAAGGVLEGLIRGRAGTAPTGHAAGTAFWVVLQHRAKALSSSMFVPGKSIYYKGVATTLKGASSIEQVDDQSLALVGKSLTPRAPAALRLSTLRSDYDTADNLTIRWGYDSDEFERTGLGNQPLGTAIGFSPVQGHFVATFKDNLGAEIERQIHYDAEIFLIPGDRTVLDALPFWTVEVVHVKGSYSSPAASLTLTPL